MLIFSDHWSILQWNNLLTVKKENIGILIKRNKIIFLQTACFHLNTVDFFLNFSLRKKNSFTLNRNVHWNFNNSFHEDLRRQLITFPLGGAVNFKVFHGCHILFLLVCNSDFVVRDIFKFQVLISLPKIVCFNLSMNFNWRSTFYHWSLHHTQLTLNLWQTNSIIPSFVHSFIYSFSYRIFRCRGHDSRYFCCICGSWWYSSQNSKMAYGFHLHWGGCGYSVLLLRCYTIHWSNGQWPYISK